MVFFKHKQEKHKKLFGLTLKTGPDKKDRKNSALDAIPYKYAYGNGIIELADGKFTKSYLIPPVNFKTASDLSQKRIAEEWSQFLGSFDTSITVQLSLYNKTIDINEFQNEVFIDLCGDSLDKYRLEYNQMLMNKMAGARNNLETMKFLTITTPADNIVDAAARFNQIDDTVSSGLAHITKKESCPMTIGERLEILHKIYHPDSTAPIYNKRMINGHLSESFTLEHLANQGKTTKDLIKPEGEIVFKNNSIEVGRTFARSYLVTNYPTWIKGTILTDFAALPANVLVTVNFDVYSTEDAIKRIRRANTNIASELVEQQKKASRTGYDASLVSPDKQDAKAECSELIQSITKDNMRLFNMIFTISVFGADEKTLNRHETNLKQIANNSLLTLDYMKGLQERCFNTSLPLGVTQLKDRRMVTSNTVASVIPFDVKDIRSVHGMYYGLNASSRNMILYDRSSAVNPNAIILGLPGAGKSFASKREMINVLLNTNDEIYVIDPEREYKVLADALNGATIKIANGSNAYLNPFDLNLENADDNGDPVKVKADFINTICDIAVGGRYGLSPIEQSVIGRCVINIYAPYVQHLKKEGKTIDTETAPTMQTFYDELKRQPEPEAANIYLALERYVKGALDIFSHKTNVEINNRFTIYDTKEIGSGLKELGLQICLDNIWNKMISNMSKGKRTWIYIDEFHVIMQKPTSAAYVAQIWKRARKWNGLPTAMTQNVEDMLKNEDARTVINNSSFIILFGQAPFNQAQLSNMLDITPEEQKYISVAKPGMGLIRIGEDIIPMDDTFPKDTELYKLMTTKPEEVYQR